MSWRTISPGVNEASREGREGREGKQSHESQALLSALAVERDALLGHPIYQAVGDRAALQTFMESHVFAVWDFMALLKALQRRLTCVEVAWAPPRSRLAARLVNEIVLGEESDEVAPGLTLSHFELYLQAMREVHADTGPVRSFIESIRTGVSPSRALERARTPPVARDFVETTLALAATGEVEELAASFLLGREDLVPAMFRRLLPAIAASSETASLRLYLERHIDVDEGEHGPLAQRLLVELCGADPARWTRAREAARGALVARRRLWDGVLRSLRTPAPAQEENPAQALATTNGHAA